MSKVVIIMLIMTVGQFTLRQPAHTLTLLSTPPHHSRLPAGESIKSGALELKSVHMLYLIIVY